MERTPETAARDFCGMISKSWTWERLTPAEREAFTECLYDTRGTDAIKGTYKHRWAVMNAMYAAFLAGLKYEPFGWREPETAEPMPKF